MHLPLKQNNVGSNPMRPIVQEIFNRMNEEIERHLREIKFALILISLLLLYIAIIFTGWRINWLRFEQLVTSALSILIK